MTPKVSIIIPVYNAKEFIKKCLENCMLQTLQDIEIVIIDDKSTDNTVETVKSYMQKDDRIKLIELEKNGRQGHARNVGIQHATADYIMFLDVDDAYEKDCVEEMYNKITADDADMTVCKFYTLDYKTKLCNEYHEYRNFADIPEQLYSGFSYKDIEPDHLFDKCNVVWDKIYKKSFIIDNNITFPGGMYCEDDVFSFKTLFRAKKITVLNKYLVYYIVNRNNSTSILGDETAFDCFKMFSLIRTDMLDLEIYYDLYRPVVGYHVQVCLYFYNLVKKELKKQFYEKMQLTLSRFWGYLEDKNNKKYYPVIYKKLDTILNNNYYTYEIKTFFEKIFSKEE